jgi:anaphase-promoting complex subunit 3
VPHAVTDKLADKHTEVARRHVPDAAAVNFLLGKLWISYGETTKAVDFFVEALKLNPFLWEAFTEICNSGMFKAPSQN